MTIRSFTSRFVSVGLALALCACGDDDVPPVDVDSGGPRDAGGGGVDAGPLFDAGPPRDAGGSDVDAGGGDVDAGGSDVDAGGTAGCGSERPDVSSITGTEGLVIARDGTIYYSQSRGVGRLVPGGTPEDGWATLTGAMTVWGLALDAANETLYAGSPTTHSIFRVDVATAMVTTLLPGAGSPNGLTMGPDGAVWYTDFGGGHAYRVDVGTGMRTMVTTSPIPSANGIAFGADGRLYVESYSAGDLFALDLTANVESGRTPIVTTGLGSPDGLAFDATGQIYVGDNSGGRLVRLAADGTSPMTLSMGISAAANVEFGHGALSCSDIYVASGGALRRYEMGTVTGAAVPWH